MIGTTLAHYEIVSRLGKGGMGEVYLAEDTKLRRQIALKLLSSETDDDRERVNRLEREAVAVAALNHPNIVTVYSVEEADDVSFLTMELVEGETLDSAIPAAGMELGPFFELALPLTDAVAAAHARGIAHRDLKPANIMVGTAGRLKVLDFGLAKVVEGAEATPTLTRSGILMGTVNYMSPEQLHGQSADLRSDVFSLGIVFYEMLTGGHPFPGDSFATVVAAIVRDPPPPLLDKRPELGASLGAVIGRCLEKDPAFRHGTAIDLLRALERARDKITSDPAGRPPPPPAPQSTSPEARPGGKPVTAPTALVAPVATGPAKAPPPPVDSAAPKAPPASAPSSPSTTAREPPPSRTDIDRLLSSVADDAETARRLGRDRRIEQARSAQQCRKATRAIVRPTLKETMLAFERQGHSSRLTDVSPTHLRLDLVLFLRTAAPAALEVQVDPGEGAALLRAQRKGGTLITRSIPIEGLSTASLSDELLAVMRELVADGNP